MVIDVSALAIAVSLMLVRQLLWRGVGVTLLLAAIGWTWMSYSIG